MTESELAEFVTELCALRSACAAFKRVADVEHWLGTALEVESARDALCRAIERARIEGSETQTPLPLL